MKNIDYSHFKVAFIDTFLTARGQKKQLKLLVTPICLKLLAMSCVGKQLLNMLKKWWNYDLKEAKNLNRIQSWLILCEYGHCFVLLCTHSLIRLNVKNMYEKRHVSKRNISSELVLLIQNIYTVQNVPWPHLNIYNRSPHIVLENFPWAFKDKHPLAEVWSFSSVSSLYPDPSSSEMRGLRCFISLMIS